MDKRWKRYPNPKETFTKSRKERDKQKKTHLPKEHETNHPSPRRRLAREERTVIKIIQQNQATVIAISKTPYSTNSINKCYQFLVTPRVVIQLGCITFLKHRTVSQKA